MGKIRLQDLARTMGLPEQDLKFKLRSIGVRVDEGDGAAIDSEIIHAFLQGKRLAQPREVILRDDSEAEDQPQPAPASGASTRQQRGAMRPTRRAMIQRVQKTIREIPTKETQPLSGARPAETPAAAQADAPATATPAVEKPAVMKTETAQPAAKDTRKKAAPAAARPAAARPAAKPAAAKPAPRPAPSRQPAPPPKKPPTIPRPAARRPTGPARPRPAPGRRRMPPGRPGPGRPMRGRPAPARGRVSEPVPQLKPASERGKRRAQRREDTIDQPTTLHFREGRPEGPVVVTENMTVRDFAEKLGIKAKDLIKTLLSQGIMAGINHQLDTATAIHLAEGLGVEAIEATFEEEALLQHETETEGEIEKVLRAPVVTVMGHVDHGKTTLLDRIRSANVVDGEAGGITQHIGAYLVEREDRNVVFLDTPGHEAFTMMRARGARVTDIVVLVVAADDGVMPQTIEAIDHAKAAEVPIVIAINKIDKANANLDRVKKDLADHGLMVEDWGGDTVAVPLSALKGDGIPELIEMILLTADLLELKASPDLPAHGVILEARKEVGRGMIATMLVQDGLLQGGDVFVAGSTWGRVRSMTDDRGEIIEEAGPSTPVEVTGFNDLPSSGDAFQVFADESKARDIAGFRSNEDRQRELAPGPKKMSLEQLFSQIGQEETQELPVIVKADVHGSVEVLRDTLEKLSTEKVRIKVIHAAVGAISVNNVIFASASNAIIIGFNVRPERNAANLAEKEEVEIRLHTIIYELIDEIKLAMIGMLQPTFREVHSGTAEVRQTFKVPKIGIVAGCYITDGTIPRNAQVRLLRDNRVVYEGKISSLRRFKDDVSEVRSGFECGIGLDQFSDIKPSDNIEAFIREEVAATL